MIYGIFLNYGILESLGSSVSFMSAGQGITEPLSFVLHFNFPDACSASPLG